jgi:beta-galactosidase/beta-glucuronidase
MKIVQLTVEQKRLSTAEAELWVFAHLEQPDDSLQLRGSLSGPFCLGVETIQLAYPLKPMRTPAANNVLAGRFIIPEPNCWSREQPFVYEGKVELWRQGALADSKPIRALFKT